MTENGRIEGDGLTAFEQVLERYGSDRTRWPAPVRMRFARLLSEDDAAGQRLKEAEALDRLLDLAPPPAVDSRMLADRIMAAVDAEAGAPTRQVPNRVWNPEIVRKRVATSGRTHGPAAALLAASLVLGMFSGLSGTFDTAVPPMVADAAYEGDVDLGQIAFDSNATSFFEEDYL
ncbi:hypothetical protein W911_12385 [Hyphomicrobium nitrativorans NL23]|uniref:Uncharacterized protein n=1 Tax=Hyphomicrobium nitrativorans NL23 TaxID=1029756 RepID=V5SG51_9HYPH|nr:hypothetical protein [Hyphomicrobium nitrativorans]AHB49020.1 hypothetical protein W911_12385 [Hyphomicrobium nitrativorans NL23]